MSTLSIWKFRTAIFAAVIAVAPLSPFERSRLGIVAKMNVPFAFETASG